MNFNPIENTRFSSKKRGSDWDIGFVQPSERRKVCGQVIKQKTESGQQMALIRDDRNMEFTLVPWRSEYEKLRKSKRVELSIQNNRVVIKEFTLGLSR